MGCYYGFSNRLRKGEKEKIVKREAAAAKTYRRWKEHFEQLQSPDFSMVRRGVFFWHNCSVGWSDTTCLPEVFQLNLRAAAAQFAQVELHMYQSLSPSSVIDGVLVCDARAQMPEEQASDMLERGWRVQHLSDFVRLSALRNGGFFCDLDQLWFNLSALKLDEKAFGHMGSCVSVLRFRGKKTHWLTNFLRRSREEVYFSVPLHFPRQSPFLDPWP